MYVGVLQGKQNNVAALETRASTGSLKALSEQSIRPH